ncbi:MAG: DUF1549 domain-containing protein, partial [Fuerstiella sp.]|nr:DUF1549 domain-containing protein [Fuerstiella sp.]
HSQTVDFDRDIRQILNDHCAACHGGVKKNGGFSVISRDLMLTTTESGIPAIVPGDIAASNLIRRVTTVEIDQRMPPEGHDGLTAVQTAKLKSWVTEGTMWPTHWAYTAPSTENPDFAGRHPVDWFIGRRLHKRRLMPSPPADATTLVRRLALDLTGLLPDLQTARRLASVPEAFPADSSELLTI